MAESHKFFENNPKIIFYKLLGTGAGDGFLWPDFSTYSILILWKKEEFANEFISKSDHSEIIEEKAYSRHDYFMQPIQTHGLWDGINPFKNCLVEKNKEDKIGIITRGKVRLSKQIDFWLNVPQASNAIKRAKDVEFYKGIGELPFLAQATFSVWKNLDSVMNFAYKSKDHSDIIKKTRKRNC